MAEKIALAIQKVKEIQAAPAHKKEDATAEAWDAIRAAGLMARKYPLILQGVRVKDVQLVLATAAERGMSKKSLRSQAQETVKTLLGSYRWMMAAQADDELMDALMRLFEGNDAMLERLKTTPEAPEDEEESEDEPQMTPVSDGAMDLLSQGWRVMFGYKFQFPTNFTGPDTDEAGEGFDNFVKGLQRMPTNGWDSELLESLTETDFVNFMSFAQGLLEKKPSWRQRARAAIKQFGVLVPAFKDVSDRDEWGPLSSKPQRRLPGVPSSSLRPSPSASSFGSGATGAAAGVVAQSSVATNGSVSSRASRR